MWRFSHIFGCIFSKLADLESVGFSWILSAVSLVVYSDPASSHLSDQYICQPSSVETL